ncbi:hypothetical protein LguiB_001825 [Lonicera macranthoides]
MQRKCTKTSMEKSIKPRTKQDKINENRTTQQKRNDKDQGALFSPWTGIRSEEFGGISPFLNFKKALRLTLESLLPLESGNLFFQQSSPL